MQKINSILILRKTNQEKLKTDILNEIELTNKKPAFIKITHVFSAYYNIVCTQLL